LPDNLTGPRGERRPIGAELKFHRNARHDAGREVYREDLRPKAGTLRRIRVAGSRSFDRVPSNERREAHRPDRKEVMEHDGKRELQPVRDDGIHERSPS
jgi:hypothetical protein